MPPTRNPNLFTLTGRKSVIIYSTSSFDGLPRLTYTKGEKTLSFAGDQIRQSNTEIGQQLTVTTERVADGFHVTLTVLLPEINLDAREKSFKALAITTYHRTSIQGPESLKGALQSYGVEELKGLAQEVLFLEKPLSW